MLLAGQILEPAHEHPLDQLEAEDPEAGHLEDGVRREGRPPAREARVGQEEHGERWKQLYHHVASLSSENVKDSVAGPFHFGTDPRIRLR